MTRINPKTHWQGVEKRQTVCRPGKSFSPRGPEFPVEKFQEKLESLSKKLLLSLRLLLDYGIYPMVMLGDKPILQPEDSVILREHWRTDNQILLRLSINQHKNKKISDYLYRNCIHPIFFVDAIHLIGTKAIELKECVAEIRLRNLGRDAIGHASGDLTNAAYLINGNFDEFSRQPAQERLRILEKLGVLVMKPGKTFAAAQQDLFDPQ
jgi:hypothetical protein